MKKRSGSILLFMLPLFCWAAKPNEIQSKPLIMVSILPQKYFVERIAAGKWDIEVMIPPGHNPAVYDPAPLQLKILSRAALYFRIGYIGFELAWMGNLKQLNPDMTIIDTSSGVDLIRDGKRIDPHIWLSLKAVGVCAGNILRALEKADPNNRRFYRSNYHFFINDIQRMDSEIRQLLSDKRKKTFMVFHPAWTYFARDYDLIQLSIETEGKHPAPSDLKKIIDEARRKGIQTIIVQAQFDTHSAETIGKAINGNVIQLDPLAPSWKQNFKIIAGKINGLLR